MTPFNKLPPAEAERVAKMMGELAELQIELGAVLLHGWGNHHPFDRPRLTNRQRVELELGDVFAVAELMHRNKDIDVNKAEEVGGTKDVTRWMHHQEKTPERTALEARAWDLLTGDMAGGLHQYDHWVEVPASVQGHYLKKASDEKNA